MFTLALVPVVMVLGAGCFELVFALVFLVFIDWLVCGECCFGAGLLLCWSVACGCLTCLVVWGLSCFAVRGLLGSCLLVWFSMVDASRCSWLDLGVLSSSVFVVLAGLLLLPCQVCWLGVVPGLFVSWVGYKYCYSL